MSQFNLGDKVVVAAHPISMFNGHRGWIVGIKPVTSSFDYHVQLDYNGSIFGFNRAELETSQ